MVTLGPEYIVQMRDSLTYFHEEVQRIADKQGLNPTTGSHAYIEHSTFSNPESIVSAWSIGNLLIEVGAEHLTGFVKLTTEPVEAIASWTCVRSMLESCALAAWLLDPAINAQSRVSRVFAIRWEGIEKQLTFMRTSGFSATEIATAELRLEEVERQALALGYCRVLDRKNRRAGVGEAMPKTTDSIVNVLDEGKMYRMLSAVTHGHHWAIRGLGYQEVGTIDFEGTVARTFQKSANIHGFALLGHCVMRSIARPLWNQWIYFGWRAIELEEILEKSADNLLMKDDRRFWRS